MGERDDEMKCRFVRYSHRSDRLATIFGAILLAILIPGTNASIGTCRGTPFACPNMPVALCDEKTPTTTTGCYLDTPNNICTGTPYPCSEYNNDPRVCCHNMGCHWEYTIFSKEPTDHKPQTDNHTTTTIPSNSHAQGKISNQDTNEVPIENLMILIVVLVSILFCLATMCIAIVPSLDEPMSNLEDACGATVASNGSVTEEGEEV